MRLTKPPLQNQMTLSEKALYHQIHPAKLSTDVSAAVVSLYFLWQHQLWIGLATHFLPPVIASALLIRFGNFDAQKNSRFGQYIRSHMTRGIEAIRFAGDIVMAVAAWCRFPAFIAVGLMIGIAAWGSGPLRHRPKE